MTRQPDEPNIDPRWDEAIELLLCGASHKLVAERVGIHRNSVRNWINTPAFRIELARRSDERLAAAKQRLAIETTRLVDRLGRLAHDAMDAAERDPKDRSAQAAARDWLRNFRKLVQIEEQVLVQTVGTARVASISSWRRRSSGNVKRST